MDLYYFAASLFSQKALMAINEQQLNVNLVPVLLPDPAQRTDYQSVYPLGKLPCLRTAEELIPESTSIVDYFDSLEPVVRLINTSAGRRIRHWDRMLDNYLIEPAVLLFFQSMNPEPDTERMEKAVFQIKTLYGMVEEKLEGKRYLVGDSFSLADITLLVGLPAAGRAVNFSDYPNLDRYFAEHRERPSFQQVKALAEPALEQLVAHFSAAA